MLCACSHPQAHLHTDGDGVCAGGQSFPKPDFAPSIFVDPSAPPLTMTLPLGTACYQCRKERDERDVSEMLPLKLQSQLSAAVLSLPVQDAA